MALEVRQRLLPVPRYIHDVTGLEEAEERPTDQFGPIGDDDLEPRLPAHEN